MLEVNLQRNNLRYEDYFPTTPTLLFTVPYVRNQQE